MSDGTIEYNLNEIKLFIETVFHTQLTNGQCVYTQASPRAPRGYGLTVAELSSKLADCKVPMPCYFGTSVVTKLDGKLRYKRDSFESLHVVVLDDIGTKIPVEKVAHFDETYVIESSAGNFQYGLVLDEPITDYDEAQLLLRLVAEAGFTDAGGCMPCKKVRLPCGVNGKKGDKAAFPVTLKHMDGSYWTPQGILTAIGNDTPWADLRKHAADERSKTRRLGASAWSKVVNYSAEGVFDPLLEWLYANDMVVDDTDPDGWIEIFCPWMDEHTSGESTCGYNPVGSGKTPASRGYNCFHEHCASRSTEEFLARIQEMGAPHCPVREPFPELTTNYVMDVQNDMAWHVKGDTVRGVKTEILRKTTPDVFLPRTDKAPLKANPVPMWLKLPSTVQVHGVTYDPTSRSPLVRDDDGTLMVNTFKLPDWQPAKINMAEVQPFIDFMDYLIPAEDERKYFLDWLACKVKDPSFRGVAMVMFAQAEGTGRNTLMQMIGKLFGTYNVRGVTMDDIMGSQWTDWRASLFAHVDESMAVSGDGKYKAYDRLKELVDPMTSTATVNPKHMPQMKVKLATSMLFFSNHQDAIHVADGTRRFYGIQNALVPAPIEMFMTLRKWMGGFDKATQWEQHVWNWLLARDVKVSDMMKSPPRSDAMDGIIHASQSTLDVLAKAVTHCWGAEFISTPLVMNLLEGLEERGVVFPKVWRAVMTRSLNRDSFAIPGRAGGFRARVNGKQMSVRCMSVATVQSAAKQEEAKIEFIEYAEKIDKRKFCDDIRSWIDEAGYVL